MINLITLKLTIWVRVRVIIGWGHTRNTNPSYVPVKSKLKHPPSPGHTGHLTSFAAWEGGNLMNLVFPGAGHLITTHRGWGI